ncbi:MAG TPA: helix-turn-helix domain-containing protein [Beijerinckiaceae bacterium]|jgi:DNA-binding HxlR family transcriptional regulator
MQRGYDQYCPISKASEILATRWTPLILRELMGGATSFNDIHRGVPLISRAVLVARLRELEHEGILERRPRASAIGHEYHLTPAGDALRAVISGFAHWGLVHARDRVKPSDLDPTVLLWGFRKRAMLDRLPDRRVVVRFEFSGVPASRTRYRILWLILERTGADVCVKDPGHPVDLVFRGDIADFVKLYLGHALWRDMGGKAVTVEGDRALAREAPGWIRLDQVVGRDFPAVRGGQLMPERARP